MAKRVFFVGGQTYTAQAFTTNLTTLTYMALKGGTATQLLDVLEVKVTGMATASAVGAMLLCRASTLEAGAPTALASPNSDGPMHPATAALANVPVSFVTAATNGPQASAVTTDGKIDCGLNFFGGIYRSNFAPTQQWSILGNTADLGESVLFNSSTAGGANGAANAHIIYEPY
jgi:hypothetical protein